mmetsp:Transcript_53532/g.122074  ORF Transcript_53532/g.122074 Transcript_53532/m.122074 type:complete len:339 (+) Transcript_53532:36-1052(+)
MSTSTDGRWALGVFFLFIVAALWAGASVLVQYIYDHLHFDEPFVLTYICTSLFAVYLPGWALLTQLGLVENPPWRAADHGAGGGGGEGGGGGACSENGGAKSECWDPAYETVSLLDGDADRSEPRVVEEEDVFSPLAERLPDEEAHSPSAPPTRTATVQPAGESGGEAAKGASGAAGGAGGRLVMSHLGTLRVSLLVCPLWFLANWTYNQSLSMTSVTSSTIISTTSTLFSFILSVLFTGEKFTLLKLFGVALCMAGTVLVTLADATNRGGADNAAAQAHGAASGAATDGGGGAGSGAGEGEGFEDPFKGHEVLGDLVALFSACCYRCRAKVGTAIAG